MNRTALLLFGWALLTAAAPLPVRLVPDPPVLGVPLLLTVELPAGAELAGLPPLTPFELLEPPRREGSALRLLLMPMRPGQRRAVRPPRLEELAGEQLLAELQRRLAAAAEIPEAARGELQRRLEQLRFAPGGTDEVAARRLRDDVLALSGGAP
jgi:hypothetical protein